MSTKRINPQLFNRARIYIDFSSFCRQFSFSLGRVNYAKAQEPLYEHIHKDSMEIVVLIKGEQTYTVSDRNYVVKSGEVFVTFPNELHSTGHYPEDKSLLYYFIINLDQISNGRIGFNNQDSRAIAQHLISMKKRVFKSSSRLLFLMDNLIMSYKSECLYKNTIIRNTVSELLLEVIHCEQKESLGEKLSVQPALDHISKHIYDDISVQELAEVCLLSVSRFKMNFRKQIGLPPHEYILRHKIELAKKLLAVTDTSIKNIAHELAFSSSQYFSTVFKRFTLISPKEFRYKSCLNN